MDAERIAAHTPDLRQKTLDDLRAILPGLFRDGRFDLQGLAELIGQSDESTERYKLTWVGQRQGDSVLLT